MKTKIIGNKKIIIIGGLIIILVLVGGIYYFKSSNSLNLLHFASNSSETMNTDNDELNEAVMAINTAQKTGEWSIDLLDNLINKLNTLESQLKPNHKNKDSNNLTYTFKLCDTAVYALSFDGDKEYSDKLDDIFTHLDSVRDLLSIDEDVDYKTAINLQAISIEVTALSEAYGSIIRYGDGLSLAKNVQRLADIGEISTDTLGALYKTKLNLNEFLAKATADEGKMKTGYADIK